MDRQAVDETVPAGDIAIDATNTPLRWHLGYRPSLDGLRGVAALLVLIGHMQVLPLAGVQHVGVQVFFVLSGFLITSLLLQENDRSGSISLRGFYWRRALRLLPVLFAFVVLSAAVLTLRGAGDRMPILLAPLSYAANWISISHAIEPVNHTWSLSVEEQFYLLWPLLLIALVRWRRLLVPVIILGIVVSILLRLHYAPSARAMWGTDTRGIEPLLVGCALSLVLRSRRISIPGWACGAAAAAIGAMCVFGARPILLSYGFSVVAVASAVLIAAGATRDLRWLTWQPLVSIGVISYGLYLWHPIVFYAFPGFSAWLLGAASIGVAAASYRWIEKPFLRLKDRSRSTQRRQRTVEQGFPTTVEG